MKNEQKEIYQSITDRIHKKEQLSELDLRTTLDKLIRLPEVYKLDFVRVLFLDVLKKCDEKERDTLIYEHFRHYVSIPCLAGLLTALKESEIKFGTPIAQLMEHIRNLQLVPGSQAKDRELLEQLQYDIIHIHEMSREKKEAEVFVDLSAEGAVKNLAKTYYKRIISSFVSESEDDLKSEEQFISELKEEQLMSQEISSFAKRRSPKEGVNRTDYLIDLGSVIAATIQKTYTKNYQGIFNGDREYVLSQFEEVIEHRIHDSGEPVKVELNKITSGILTVVLELVFNSGFSTFRKKLDSDVYKSLKGLS